MRETPENLPKLPLHLRANPHLDSPESMFAAISRLTGAYVDANDFPIDALMTILLRNEVMLLITQSQLGCEERVSDEVLSHMVWAMEGLNSEALTIARIWGRHRLAKQRQEEEAVPAFAAD